MEHVMAKNEMDNSVGSPLSISRWQKLFAQEQLRQNKEESGDIATDSREIKRDIDLSWMDMLTANSSHLDDFDSGSQEECLHQWFQSVQSEADLNAKSTATMNGTVVDPTLDCIRSIANNDYSSPSEKEVSDVLQQMKSFLQEEGECDIDNVINEALVPCSYLKDGTPDQIKRTPCYNKRHESYRVETKALSSPNDLICSFENEALSNDTKKASDSVLYHCSNLDDRPKMVDDNQSTKVREKNTETFIQNNTTVSTQDKTSKEEEDTIKKLCRIKEKHLLRKCLKGLLSLVKEEGRQLDRVCLKISKSRQARLLKKTMRAWNIMVQQKMLKIESLLKFREYILVNKAFSFWFKVAYTHKEYLRRTSKELVWKLKARTFRAWQRFAKHEKSQREDEIEELQRVEHARLDAKASIWRRSNILTKSLLGWNAVAQIDRAERLRCESQRARKNRIHALLQRACDKATNNTPECEHKSKPEGNFFLPTTAKNISNDNFCADKKEDTRELALNCMINEYILRKANDNEKFKDRVTGTQSHIVKTERCQREKATGIEQRLDSDKENIKAGDNKSTLLSTLSKQEIREKEMSKDYPRNTKNEYIIRMEQRREERAKRRKALHDRYINAQKEREEVAIKAANRREEERQRLIRIEKERIENEEYEKLKKIEERREAWRMAKLHFKLIVVKRAITCWKELLKKNELKVEKAQIFWRDSSVRQSWDAWLNHVQGVRQCRDQIIQKKLKEADEYYCDTLMFMTFENWRYFAQRAQIILVPKVESIINQNRVQRNLVLWEYFLNKEQKKQQMIDRASEMMYKDFVFRRIFRYWKVGIRVLQQERLVEERVAEKWRDVNKWLEGKDREKKR